MALTKLQSQSIDTNITVAGVVTATSFISTSLSVSGVSTLGNVKIGSGSTTLIVDGDARITGILTIGTSSITFDGLNNEISLGTGVTITTSEILIGGNSINSTDLVVENINASGVITATSFVGDGSGLTGAGSTVVDDTSTNQTLYPVLTAQTSGTITSSKVSTTKLSFNPSTGVVSGTGFSGSGASLTSLNATQLTSGIVPSARITETSPLTVNGDLYVAGNISFGGTTTQLNTSQVTFSDPDIVLGVGTTSTFNPTDNTANHGGIAVASTEGYPLVNLNIDAAETLPTTYKKIMWFKNNAAGLGTDAWLSNYAVGIGSTQFPDGTRLVAGNVQFDANDLKVVRDINASGVVTATSFIGNLTGNITGNLTGNLNSSGVSTFSNGPVLIGSGTSTGTASQRLQVTGGGYFSGDVGIGITNPSYPLDVNGAIRFGGTGNNEGLLRVWGSVSDTDVDGLLPGSAFGNILEGSNNGHIVIGIRDNDVSDSFSIISGGSNYQTDTTYDTLVAYFRADGNVGLGTNSPAGQLNVRNGPVIVGSGTSTGTASQPLQVTGGGYVSGNLGVGITNPLASLHVNGNRIMHSLSGANTVEFGYGAGSGDTNGYGLYVPSGKYFYLYANAGFQLSATSTGVGIGTTNPGQALDVSGSIRASSQLISTVATGTAPLSVASTTLVTNLNADLLDGENLVDNASTANTIVGRDASGNITANRFASTVATGTSPFTVSSTTLVSNLNADLFDGVESLTYSASLRANRNISGGGTITVDASFNVLWSTRFIVISNGRGSYFSTTGYFDINCPTSGTITGVGGAANVTATAAGIPLGAWQAIYYILPIGSSNTSLAANFRVASYTADLDIPHSWVLICVRNGEDGAVTFNNGITLTAGQSLSSLKQANANTANTLVRRDASGNFSAGTITATLSGNASTATNATNLSTNRTNWSTNGTISAVVGQLAWKNYGNNHTIFDASASTSPDGGAVNNTNAQIAWTGSYPTLMGWNGANTYGVRVDSARVADGVSGTTSNGFGTRTVQAGGSATGGADGDIYYIY